MSSAASRTSGRPRASGHVSDRSPTHATCRASSPACGFFPAMEVFRPATLDEALRLKAEHPDARFVQGGTDVMVELTFGHSRPTAIVDLSELAELRGFAEEDGTLRLGAGLTYTEAMQSPLASRVPALAEASRTV